MNRTRVRLAGALVAALAITTIGTGVARAATSPPLPPLAFVAATPNVHASRYVSGEFTYLDLDLGLNVIAGRDPFEIKVNRRSYADPVVAQQIVTQNGRKVAVSLPRGMVTAFGGFKNFARITMKDASGAVVKDYQTDFCPNGADSARTRPDAPATTPYPRGCRDGWNPFTLGAVWGIQAGWNAPVGSYPGSTDPWSSPDFDLPAGKLAVTVTLNPVYRDYFRFPASGSVQQLNLTVVEVTEEPARGLKAASLAAAPPAATGEHAAHAGEGDASRQVSAYRPEFRPPAKVPATLAAVPKTGPRPDLKSLPAWGISLTEGVDEVTEEPDGKWYVNFGATVWNAGTSPLLVDGFRRTGTELMDAYQYFFDTSGNQVGSVPAGTMEWDAREGHLHWHFTDFAQYNLLSSDAKLAVRSGKEAFCLANTDQVDYTIPNAKWRPENVDLATSCGGNTAVAVREVLDIGNGDTYGQNRPGQSFEVTNLPNGTYYIQVVANPEHKLTEQSTTNNTSLRKIVLGGTATGRTLEVPPVNGIEG